MNSNIHLTGSHRELWELRSRGTGFCGLGGMLPNPLFKDWAAIKPLLPARDRYSQAKLALVFYAYLAARDPINATRGHGGVGIHFIYRPWQS
ncbi:hypothetical protein [Cupriavidus metallidurans]|uniref:hypothetical protein n=1 Tax=Cupriavidus metallidurans TaxID=119219 RepID=UPI001CCDA28B|nr:hypothetical protein [Cupriavidus metallidurans]UBM09169.1 hypothetical protein LAI70_04555 [Cupriavidus metallidurans]